MNMKLEHFLKCRPILKHLMLLLFCSTLAQPLLDWQHRFEVDSMTQMEADNHSDTDNKEKEEEKKEDKNQIESISAASAQGTFFHTKINRLDLSQMIMRFPEIITPPPQA